MVSRSMNQVLLRSINTTVVSILPVISLLVVGAFIMGAVTLEEFSIALLVGLIAGAYSSVFVAAPILVWAKEREPRYRSIRQRLSSSGIDISENASEGNEAPRVVAAAADGETASSAPLPVTGTVIPPRPRKKKK